MSQQTINVGNNSKKTVLILAVAAILLIVAANSFFVLYEGESALVQRFGEIRGVYVREADDTLRGQFATESARLHTGTGLKIKVPFIDNVIKYPAKLILYDSPPTEVLTFDKQRLYFDNSAKWRIDNPLRFYQRFNNIDSAKTRINDVLQSEMRIRVGRMNSYILISDREQSGQMLTDLVGAVNNALIERAEGISVVDIRIRRTDLPVETYASIHNRMNTERQRIATGYRSEGEERMLEIRSTTDREVETITSEARRKAEEIRGQADGEAARIYNEAYSRDPAFFEFYNLLDTYRQTVGSGTTMVIPLDSPFAQYLLGITPEAAPVAAAPPPAPAE